MSQPPRLPELHKLFPQLAQQLKCLGGDHRLQHLSHQSSTCIVRCMRDLLSDPCHALPEALVHGVANPAALSPAQRIEALQLKKEALDDVASLVAESSFACAPRFPGRIPSLIRVEDKKSMIVDADLYPGYKIPSIGFCFDVLDRNCCEFRDGDRVVIQNDSKAGSKVGLILRRVSQKRILVRWEGENEEETDHEESALHLLVKVRILITAKIGKSKKDDGPLTDWCQILTALTTNDDTPKELFVCTDTNYTLESNRDPNQLKAFVEDLDSSICEAKMTLLDQCHEYTILKGLARRLAESFFQLTKFSGERKYLQDLKLKYQKIIDLELEQKDKKDVAKDSAKEQDEAALKKKWQEKEARHSFVNEAFLKWKISPICGYETILKSIKKAWSRVPCVLDTESAIDFQSKSVFERRFSAIFRWSQCQPQPCRLVPDPYHLTQSTVLSTAVCGHYFSEASARADCLSVGDLVASSSLDPPQNYITVSAFRYNDFDGKWIDECFRVADGTYAISVDISMCPSWRSLLTQDAFFELDFNGCGNVEVFKIDYIERISHVHFNVHFKCSPYHHKSFLKWFEVFEKSELLTQQRAEMQQLKDHAEREKSEAAFLLKKASVKGFKELNLGTFFFFRPFASESFGRFHTCFEYLREICYLFCHIIAKGLLERHDHDAMLCEQQHLFDSSDYKYDDYHKFLRREGCFLIYPTVVNFLQEADKRRIQLLDIMPYGVPLRDDTAYKSCLNVANQVQDILFLVKEAFKNVLDCQIPQSLSQSGMNPLDNCYNVVDSLNSSFPLQSHPSDYRLKHCYCSHNQQCESCKRHNQGCLRRSIYCYNSSMAEPTEVERNFDAFELFVDPLFSLPTLDDENEALKARDLCNYFFNMKRSLHSLELGFVCTFNNGSPAPVCVASIFLALRCRHNTNLLGTFQNQYHPHFKRYFELICFCGKFVRTKQATSSHSALTYSSVGHFSTHRLVEVRMCDSTGRNVIINDVLTRIHENLSHRSKNFHFKRRLLNQESGPIVERVQFLAFLDSSRRLLAACYNDDILPALFWIPTPNTDSLETTRVINGPEPTLLWKNIDERYSLTAISSTKAGKDLLSTESQALKFEFLQFASHILDARYYYSNDNQVELSIDLLSMWFDSRREIDTFTALKMYMCMLPPHEFTEMCCKTEADLVFLMKFESQTSNFCNLNTECFDLSGLKRLPNCQYESWLEFLRHAQELSMLKDEDKSEEDCKRLELWAHMRTLAEWIDESVEDTFNLFWQYRISSASRSDACRQIHQFFHWSNVDKVFFIFKEFVTDYCVWIRSDNQTHFDLSSYIPNPQPLVCLISGLILAIDCLAKLPQYVECSSEDNGSSPAFIYEQILDLLLLDSRPGIPLIHLLHALDGTIRITSDFHGILPSTYIALALQPAFVRLLSNGFSMCSLQTPCPLILTLEQRTWSILVKSFETSASFLSGDFSDSQINIASQSAWVQCARALLQCCEFWACSSSPDHWQPEVDSFELCKIVDCCLRCFAAPFNVCSNDCIVVSMDLLASIIRLCASSHDKVSSAMGIFRRFASLLPGSTVRATIPVKGSALKLLGACFQLGLQPKDLDEFMLHMNSSPNTPDLHFSSAGHSFGGGPLLSLGGIDLIAVDTFIEALHAPASSKLVPWFVAPMSPVAAVSQICRFTMLFCHDLKVEQIMPNIRQSQDVSSVAQFFDLSENRAHLNDRSYWLEHLVDCSTEIFKIGMQKTNLFSVDNQSRQYLSHLPKPTMTSSVSTKRAELESSFWLHLLSTALVHLKAMLAMFVSFTLNKELSFTDSVPFSKFKQHAVLFPHFESSLDHPISAPSIVLRPVVCSSSSSFFVMNPLCVPVFVKEKLIERNSESRVLIKCVSNNEFNSVIPISAYNSFLSILQVLMNGRLKVVEDIIAKVSQQNPGRCPFEGTCVAGLLKQFCSQVQHEKSQLFESPDPAFDFSEGHERRFCFEHMMFLTDLFRLCVVDGSDTANSSPNSISYVIRVAASLAAIPARQTSKIFVSTDASAISPAHFDPLPPLLSTVWPLTVALFVPGFASLSSCNEVHKIINLCADHFTSLCLDLTGHSYKIAANSLNEHSSLSLSDVLKCLAIEHVLPPQSNLGVSRNSHALHAPRLFLDDLSRILSVSGFCSDPGSMQIKEERDIAMKYFLPFLCVQTSSSGFSGIPSELLQCFKLNSTIVKSLCHQNFQPRFGRPPLLILPNLHQSSDKVINAHLFPTIKCSFDEQWYHYLKQLVCCLNCYHTSLVTSLFMLDFIQSFYSATSRRSKFLSMGFSYFSSNPKVIAYDLFLEYQPQHLFVGTVVNIISSMGCLSPNPESLQVPLHAHSREIVFIKKCFEFLGSIVEDNFVIECCNPSASNSLQLDMSLAKSRLQDLEFDALQRNTWDAASLKGADHRHAIERRILSPSISRIEAVKVEIQRTQVGPTAHIVFDKWRREVQFSAIVDVFNGSSCALWNQEHNTFLQRIRPEIPYAPYLFDNQDLLLLKAAFREDFGISGARDELLNGVYELSFFNGDIMDSKYRINPRLSGARGSHYRSFPAYSQPDSVDLPMLYFDSAFYGSSKCGRWVISQGSKIRAYLEAPYKFDLKFGLTMTNWKENDISSNIRLELLSNTTSPVLNEIRRTALFRMVHKTGGLDTDFKELYKRWVTSANRVFESLCLYSKSSIFEPQLDCTLPSFLGCFSSMISLLPRSCADLYSPPMRNICLVLTHYLRASNPDDPHKLLSSSTLSSIGVILSTFSMAADIPELFDPSKSSFVPLFVEYVLGRIYRELVCFCDSSISPVLKEQSSFCCSRGLDTLLSLCSSSAIATSVLSLASVLGAVAHCYHAVHLWESESPDPHDMYKRVWKIKESLFTYRSLGTTSNAYERSLQHRNYVKIIRFLSLVCERSRREETFSLRSNIMLSSSMHSLVDAVGSNIDQQVPMDALNCVRLSLECWPRISDIVFKLKQTHEPGMNASVVRSTLQSSPQNLSLGDLHELSAWISLASNSMCALPTVIQPKLHDDMKILVSHLVDCLFRFETVVTDLWDSKLYHTASYCGIRNFFCSSEENPSEDALLSDRGRSVYVHQPLTILCGSISHICYCLQTLYFFKTGSLPRVLFIEGKDENCDKHLIACAVGLLDALVQFFTMSQETSCSLLDAEYSMHRFTEGEMNCFASAVESLFELCLRIRMNLNSDPNAPKQAHMEHDILCLVQKLHPANHNSKYHSVGQDVENHCKHCEEWRTRSFQIYKRVFVLLQQCGDSLDLPKSLLEIK